MGLKQCIQEINKKLIASKIDHALIGGFALALHGITRATGDIDLIVLEENKNELIEGLDQIGYKLQLETKEVLHFLGPARVDILLAKRPLSKQMLGRAKLDPVLNIKFLQAEDIIGLKIQAYCNNSKRTLQDKADIQYLMNQYPGLDYDQIKIYADLFNQWDEIKKLRP